MKKKKGLIIGNRFVDAIPLDIFVWSLLVIPEIPEPPEALFFIMNRWLIVANFRTDIPNSQVWISPENDGGNVQLFPSGKRDRNSCRKQPLLKVYDQNLAKKICKAQISSCAPFFTLSVKPTKFYSIITSCAERVTPHTFYTKSTQTISLINIWALGPPEWAMWSVENDNHVTSSHARYECWLLLCRNQLLHW